MTELPVSPVGGNAAAAGKPMMRGWLHAGGVAATLFAGPWLIDEASRSTVDRPVHVAETVIYAVAMLALFGVSASFHLISWSPKARRRMRRADHSTIFVAIAGTYTAAAGLSLGGWAKITVLVIAWGGGAVGIALRQLWLDAPKWAIAVPYVAVGWVALTVAPELMRGLGEPGFFLLLAGGLAYTVGALVYALRKPDPAPRVFGYHEVFHACTIAGAAVQFVVVAGFALPRAGG